MEFLKLWYWPYQHWQLSEFQFHPLALSLKTEVILYTIEYIYILDYIDHHPNNQLVIIVPIIITLLTKPACSAVSAPWTLTIADLRSPFLTKWTHSEEYFDASDCCGRIMKVIDTIVILHYIFDIVSSDLCLIMFNLRAVQSGSQSVKKNLPNIRDEEV